MASKSSTTTSRPLPETVAVAFIRRPHGVRGEVAADLLSDHPTRLARGSRLMLRAEGAASRPVEIASSRPHKSGVVLRLVGCEGRAEAEALRGATLEVARDEVPPAPEGSWYVYELVGCRCVDEVEGELGSVAEVVEDGGGHLLLVEGDRGRLPIPLVHRFLKRVDVAEGLIELRLPDGLVEICASRS